MANTTPVTTVTAPLVHCFVMFGMGGAALDPAGGEITFVNRINQLKGTRVHGSPYQYYQTQEIANAIMLVPSTDYVVIGGDSLGANDGPLVAQGLKGHRKVDYLFGFQPSLYGEHITVPNNVAEALCIWNPNFFTTLGLGNYEWQLDPGNTVTNLREISNNDLHPADYDVALQNVILADIMRIGHLKSAS